MGYVTPALLHLNGANAATVYPNDSDSGLTFSNIPSGVAAITTSDSVFGGASLENGADNSLGGLISNRKVWINGDFTMRTRFRTANNAFLGAIMSVGDQTLNPRALLVRMNSAITSAGDVRVFLGGTPLITSAAAVMTNGTWGEVMLERIGNVLYLGVDGGYQGCAMCPGPIGGDYIVLGNYMDNGSFAGLGSSYAYRFDEFHFTDGLARHKTFPFAVATAEFVRDGRKALNSVQLRQRRMDMFSMMGVPSISVNRTEPPNTQTVTMAMPRQTSGKQSGTSSTTRTWVPSIAPLVGSKIICTATGWVSGAPPTMSVTDNATPPNTYTVRQNNSETSTATYIIDGTVANVPTTITLTFSAAADHSVDWAEFNGLGNYDTGTSNNLNGQQTTFSTGPTPTLAQASEVVIAALGLASGASNSGITVPSGFVSLGIEQDSPTYIGAGGAYTAVAPTTPITTVWGTANAGAGSSYVGAIATYRLGNAANVTVNRTEAANTQTVTVANVESVSVAQTQAANSQTATLFHQFAISATQTQPSNSQTFTIANVLSVSVNQTRPANSQTTTLANVESLSVNQTLPADTQSVSMTHTGVALVNAVQTQLADTKTVTLAAVASVGVSRTEAANTQTVTVTHPTAFNVSVNQTQAADSMSAAIAASAAISVAQTRAANTQTATLALSNAISAVQTQVANAQAASLIHTANVSVNRTEAATSQTAALVTQASIAVAQTQAAATQAANFALSIGINGSRTEAPNTQAVSIARDVSVSVNRTELPNTQNARFARPVVIVDHERTLTIMRENRTLNITK